ncbi:hypothetical protein KDX16_16225 [Burkholderia vietnamiensis]|jgi:hypothetical protein|uniref:Uncharacterized protein n=1 Tax=Burkholderia aenigmatica TaxID=2015348 RepID=A0A6P2TA79_9BURK|nr:MULTISPECIES: hypothetical protein [Burkholderia cepacia complex]HDR9756622.1 hypothetical protein [Burkholderia cepacia ATCC 25416]MBR7917372.1 hypothetical protein [Burkholderia vietnamiensis]MBR8054320.1 hypothetical protein [Burkholderia vietnamiensis]VWC52618.1 hypothetical protein BLA13014_08010 [Burkholderia aenigmatica]HDR9789616.1 hypothetical protein [Burkholderia cepacia ATCC 25416]
MKFVKATLAASFLIAGPVAAQTQQTDLPHPCQSSTGQWTLCIGDSPIDTTGNRVDMANEVQQVNSALAPLRQKITEFVQTEHQAATAGR